MYFVYTNIPKCILYIIEKYIKYDCVKCKKYTDVVDYYNNLLCDRCFIDVNTY